MKNLSVRSLCASILALFIAPAWADDLEKVQPESVGLSSERLARFSAQMEKGIAAGDFPGAVAAVARNGKIGFFESYGMRDEAAGLPMEDDAIFRIASMTKAITGVAVMILYEEGHFSLNDPISYYIPSFSEMRVAIQRKQDVASLKEKERDDWSLKELEDWLAANWPKLTEAEQTEWTAYYYEKAGSKGKGKSKGSKGADSSRAEGETEPANRQITIRDLLRHTAGLSYDPGEIWQPGDDLEALINNLAAVPLSSHPGTEFQYGLSQDVLARLVEVISGQSFDVFIQERIFDPLDMKDTGFWVQPDNADRLVVMKEEASGGKGSAKGSVVATYLEPPVILMGGTGLVSTTMDYLRFCQMLLNNGELDGARILGRKSVELMHTNHMDDVQNPNSGSKTGGEFLFGLTFGIKGDPGKTGELTSEGAYYWGGAYGTTFWIDPAENLVGVFMVNGLTETKGRKRPYSTMLEHYTYQAIVD